MTQTIWHEPVRFINAEPHVEDGTAFIVLSFGGEEGPIEDRSVSLGEARELVMDVLTALAKMGDPACTRDQSTIFHRRPGLQRR